MMGVLKIGAFAALIISGLAGSAQAYIPDDACAVIVASRRTVAEVQSFVRENPQIEFGPVYESSNGWYALSAGTVLVDAADASLERLKSSGLIPADSYCSRGNAYVGVAASSPTALPRDEDNAPHVPLQHGLYDGFDARPMSAREKRYLQAALALEGSYNALLDGVWGRGSQEALERFSWSEFDAEPSNAHAALAMLVASHEFEEGSWGPAYYSRFDISVLLPLARIEVRENRPGRLHLVDERELVDIWVFKSSGGGVGTFHRDALASHNGPEEPYTLRRDDLWVTTYSKNGVRDYVRSRWSQSPIQN